MNYPYRPPMSQRIRTASLWLLVDMLNALSRLAFRVGRVLSDASNDVAVHEFTNREKTIR
jgi:hypothetical protein